MAVQNTADSLHEYQIIRSVDTMPAQRTLQNTMTLGRKIGLFLDYLQNGNEIESLGYTWVWLDDYVTRTEMDDQGNERCFGIDGLAIKMTRYHPTDPNGATEPHYIGKTDIPLTEIIHIIDHIKEVDWLGMCGSMALQGMTKKRA